MSDLPILNMVYTVISGDFHTMTAELSTIDRAAFDRLVEVHQRELYVHCYRMMGALDDAEDVLQESLLRAWRHRDTYEGRATLRAWLYKIATNCCLDALEKRSKRRYVPLSYEAASTLDEPIPPEVKDPIWLDPFPDELLAAEEDQPDTYYEIREHITLAFITLMHRLPPRQRAVFVLREVLDWEASEVAELLGTTVSSVKSALHRARLTINTYRMDKHDGAAPPQLDVTQQIRLAAYMQAWQTADVEGLVALLHDDATFSMPPIPSWFQGRTTIAGLVAKTVFAGSAKGRWRLVPTRANGQIGYGLYRLDATQGDYAFYGIQVVTFAGEHITDIITFRKPSLHARFDLTGRIST